jgi:tetratricopeptide (TPR) repeat protein
VSQTLSGVNSEERVKRFLYIICLILLARSSIADQRSVDAALDRAINAFNKGRFEEAEKLADEAEKGGSKKPEVANLLGATYTRLKRYDDAVEKFNQALALDPKFYPARLNLAETKLLQGKYADAQNEYQVLKEQDPDSEVVDFKLVLCFLLEGQDVKANLTVDTMKFPGKTPAYYYARAAIALKRGGKEAVDRYYGNAKKYYTDAQCEFFAQSLKEIDFAAAPPAASPVQTPGQTPALSTQTGPMN